MNPTLRLLTGAAGAALLIYGLMQDQKSKQSKEILESDVAKGEGHISMTIGGLLLLAALLSGCGANVPIEQQYYKLEWARTSVQQAEAECHAEIQRNPLLGLPTCMRAKGWQER